jgi:transposase-like protein
LANQRRWQCREKHARRQFSVKVGTIFEDSPISLDKWFVAIWLISSAKNGISSYELHRAIGITQKSAWFVLHRVRLAMQTKSFNKIGGEVEVDETFIGGKARNMHASKRTSKGFAKTTVQGMLKRTDDSSVSTIHAEVKPSTWKEDLQAMVFERVDPSATVFTDKHGAYTGLEETFVHHVIDHMTEYVNGNIHTNGIENFWSLLKRGLKGTYVSVEPFNLFRYVDEQAFRFNSRKQKDGERFSEMLARVVGKRLTLAELTAQPQPQSA